MSIVDDTPINITGTIENQFKCKTPADLNKITKSLDEYTSVLFGRLFNKQITQNILPLSIKTVTFGRDYNQVIELDSLPKGLTSLFIGAKYNQPLNIDVLPQSLTLLSFRAQQTSVYNQEFKPGVLPASLRTMLLGESYNKSLSKPGCLPGSLNTLELGRDFAQSIKVGTFQNSLTKLTMESIVPDIDIGALPNSLIELSTESINYGFQIGLLPSSLKILRMNRGYIRLALGITKGSLPESLESLTLGLGFNHPIQPGMLPNSLTSLTLGNQFNKTLAPGALPSSINSLVFGDGFDQILTANVLPSSLTSLTIGRNQTSAISFPSLKHLNAHSLDQLNYQFISVEQVMTLTLNEINPIIHRRSQAPITQHVDTLIINWEAIKGIDGFRLPQTNELYIKAIIKTFPNASTYIVTCSRWNYQIRGISSDMAIVYSNDVKKRLKTPSITVNHKVEYLTLS
ncbi:hypothetical protein SAMD00019534_026330 [Acytostelium subglobosum LB1]|uniref:hypothetical protein n=1 Tax=Acytostelium subglobosum LB1 TaxID=1410327 RepID=UPI000644BDFF|nr:hypothetical protein SAMD00019534_026330 [Acytostelium subglobosum LB1]GAM19458.1 hypothetical protein SAMD00019534_026330 [Acytostelium subglobosum LB1]|eukprot:XP_012757385.1 hypothetical protein SAMD00019534_026330 [Acytostelium subglobosum LB1]